MSQKKLNWNILIYQKEKNQQKIISISIWYLLCYNATAWWHGWNEVPRKYGYHAKWNMNESFVDEAKNRGLKCGVGEKLELKGSNYRPKS